LATDHVKQTEDENCLLTSFKSVLNHNLSVLDNMRKLLQNERSSSIRT